MTHRPRKRFGQNFLQDPGVLQRITHAIHPKEGERIVEIGPGMGALTTYLLEQVPHLYAVELDRDLITLLQQRFTPAQLTLTQGDALQFDFCSLAEPSSPLRLIGNLPYNISTPLLFHLFENKGCITDMHFMLQQEVVARMEAPPGSKTYGRLSIMTQYHCAVERLFGVPPEAFNPPPKVESAIVRLRPHRAPPVEVTCFTTLQQVVTQAFSQRRKTIRNTLKKLVTAAQLESLGIDPTIRPEQLDLATYARISNLISATAEPQ